MLLLALAAFWLAQALAVAHASRHDVGDRPGLPASHAALCTDCASMLPLLAVAGGIGAPLALVQVPSRTTLPPATTAAFAAAPQPAFRSRAPPR